jgi:hypothetical protein
MPLSNTIDEVIERLDEIIQTSITERSRNGYFAALYKGVTVEIRRGIAEGLFEDGLRMERFDVAFANRYLDALSAHRAGQETTRSWLFAFESAGGSKSVILQHLLLGINAHINLDLGIAAAEISKGGDLAALRNDFQKVNDILASRVRTVQDQIARVSPLTSLLERVDPNANRAAINFSIERARDQAWTVAELLSFLPESVWQNRVDVVDQATLSLARLVRDPPGWVLGTGLGIIRLSEIHNIPHVIRVLADISMPDG